MRKYKQYDGMIVDLDNSNIYTRLSKDINELNDKMFYEIGYVLCYMDYLQNAKHFTPKCAQRKRVMKLIKNFCKNRSKMLYETKNVQWFQEQVFLFQDETENMC